MFMGEIKDKDINHILNNIKKLINPMKLIVFHKKISHSGKILSFKVCLVVNVRDKIQMEKNIYKNIDSDIPFDVILYTSEEWERSKTKEDSFANKILQRGYFIYGKE